MTCAQTGSYNDPNRLRRTKPNPTIHPWRPKIPCHQWTSVLSKNKNPYRSLQVLSKVKNLVWRVTKNPLPTMMNLVK